MTKEDYVEYWIEIAQKDWEILWKLYESNDFVYCLFFSHLVIEKLSKGIWVKNCVGNLPPRSHNSFYILDQAKVELSTEQVDFLLVLNEFNIDGRYPDYKQRIYQITNKEYTDDLLIKIKEMRECLLKLLQ